jgi:hypothetical protein
LPQRINECTIIIYIIPQRYISQFKNIWPQEFLSFSTFEIKVIGPTMEGLEQEEGA